MKPVFNTSTVSLHQKQKSVRDERTLENTLSLYPAAGPAHTTNAHKTPKQRGFTQTWHHCSSATYKSIQPSTWSDCVCVGVCALVLYRVQAGRRDVTYSQRRFTEQAWQTHKWLPGIAIPLHTPCCFFFSPKRTVTLCHYGNKWLLVCWAALIIMENSRGLYKLSRQGPLLFSFLLFFPVSFFFFSISA